MLRPHSKEQSTYENLKTLSPYGIMPLINEISIESDQDNTVLIHCISMLLVKLPSFLTS